MMEQLSLKTISKHLKDKMIGSMDGGGVINQIVFINEVTRLVDKGRPVVVYLDFSKAFDSVSHNILIDKLTKHSLRKWAVKWKMG